MHGEPAMTGPFRTFLFAPGNHARRRVKVFEVGADAVILDLEDAVPVAEKVDTRGAVTDALKRSRTCPGYVRVNGYETEFCYSDILAVAGPWLDGIVLPMVETPAQLRSVDWLLAQIERDRGMARGAIDLMPIIETGRGVDAVTEIAGAGTRTRRLSFGAADYTLDVGMRWSVDEGELAHARAAIVLASRVAGIEPPVDTVFVHIRDEENLRRSATTARDLGFQGKLCIHPDQIAPVNGIFTPSEAEVAEAEKIVAAFEEAEAAGSASIQVDGRFVDYPVVDKARRILALIERIRG